MHILRDFLCENQTGEMKSDKKIFKPNRRKKEINPSHTIFISSTLYLASCVRNIVDRQKNRMHNEMKRETKKKKN